MSVALPIILSLRHSGWISGNTGEPSDTPYLAADIIEELYEALDELLKHAGIADAAAEDIDGEDHHRESVARRALAKARGEA